MQVKGGHLNHVSQHINVKGTHVRTCTCMCMRVYFVLLVCVSDSQSCPSLCNPMDCSQPGASLSMGFPRQEYCSGLPSPSPGDLPDPGIEPGSPASWMDSLLTEPPGKLLDCQGMPCLVLIKLYSRVCKNLRLWPQANYW